jgi:hypothetical protein
MAVLTPVVFFQVFDNNGDPLSNGTIESYEAGTTTPKDTFTDADETATNTNPIVLDASGRASIWLGEGAYKFILKDSTGAIIETVDDFAADSAGAIVTYNVNANLNLTAIYENSLIIGTGTFTINLLPAADAGDGFNFRVRNGGSGVITINPDGAETINGSATLDIPAGSYAEVFSDESNWQALAGFLLDINGYTDATVTTADEFIFGDVDDSNNTKKDTVQGILDLVPADLQGKATAVVAADDTFNFFDTDDSNNIKTDTVQGIIDLIPEDDFVLLGEITASAATSVDIGSGLDIDAAIDGTYGAYMIRYDGVFCSTTDSSLDIRTSTDGGTTFDSTASDYREAHVGYISSGAPTNWNSNGRDSMRIAFGSGNSATQTTSGYTYIYAPSDATQNTAFSHNMTQIDFSNNIRSTIGSSTRYAAEDVDAVRVAYSSGTITGRIKFFGIK